MTRFTVASVLVASAVAIATGTTNLTPDMQHVLTPIDSIPTREQLNTAFNNDPGAALQNLSALSADADSDIGIRLRAIHALAKYCPATPCVNADVAHQSVIAVVTSNSGELVGSAVLLLRAAIESLGPMGVKSDIGVLVPLLDHTSRDVRSATARALRDLCNTQAIVPLRVRFSKEQTEQVRLAISEALRILDQCP